MSNEFAFNLSSLAPKTSAYPVNIIGVSPDGIQSYYATSSITVLLAGNDTIPEQQIRTIHH
ncbi:uncharacterized protein BDZ99DRAFT_468103 [Mytilinidion resinicola]|uniref:Uncharacterized protein n=1 Tax=Mytilinidion resinicola TaxID=574789 RepID=A0A6A6Y449_9PEZI|nr:uncharacterized protein BDZ99DRAFT_468103 [Mytilinidion resinicola]KAF2803562.1 hypothetical protein BDZ99DRAFT_468103 [Mytilinidion resinicola]